MESVHREKKTYKTIQCVRCVLCTLVLETYPNIGSSSKSPIPIMPNIVGCDLGCVCVHSLDGGFVTRARRFVNCAGRLEVRAVGLHSTVGSADAENTTFVVFWGCAFCLGAFSAFLCVFLFLELMSLC